jgi:hypothetical protein
MISDNYEGIIEKRIQRTQYIEAILARLENGPASLLFAEQIGHRFITDLPKEDSSTHPYIETVIGERSKRLKEVRDYQPQDIDQSHMRDVLEREPQFPGGF